MLYAIIGVKTNKCIVMIGSDTGSTLIQQMNRVSLDHPNSVTTTNSLPFYIYCESAACVIANTMYVAGVGQFPYKELWKLSKSLKWQKLAEMPTGRRRHGVAVINSTIYVLGGWKDADKTILDDVMSYNTEMNTWSNAEKLVHAVSSFACLSYNSFIYLFGGHDINDEAVS